MPRPTTLKRIKEVELEPLRESVPYQVIFEVNGKTIKHLSYASSWKMAIYLALRNNDIVNQIGISNKSLQITVEPQ